MVNNFHTPVLLSEAVGFLNVKKNHWYIDCNLGGGGQTKAILEKGGRVLAIDVDPDAISYVSQNMATERLILHQGNFSNLEQIAKIYNLTQVSGVLFDLGVSSYQFDNPAKGFSFRSQSPLDMRMDPTLQVRAEDLLHGLNVNELEELFRNLGEEPFAKKIAQAIITHRKLKPIKTAQELVDIILTAKPLSFHGIHPATLVFQALRIAVNDELNSLRKALPQALDILEPSGRIVVISFHSLEDRIVKDFSKNQEILSKLKTLTKKPVIPSQGEIAKNPRSRSAKLRCAEKLP